MAGVGDLQNNALSVERKQPQHRKHGILWIALIVLAGSCLYRYLHNRHFVAQTINFKETKSKELSDKINPNNATWASLARLPGIGTTRAQRIVAYREKYTKNHPENDKAFNSSEDLTKVKGIGPVISSQVKEFLTFENP